MRIVLMALCALLVLALRPACAENEAPKDADGFTVHEWGVFTHYQNQAFANAARDEAWRALPKEVFGITPGRSFPKRCLGADKPIVYFYRSDALKNKARSVDVRVDFPGGAPLVWHPRTVEPMGGYWGMRRVGMEEITSVQGEPGHLLWQLNFAHDPQGALACPNYAWKDAALAAEADLFADAHWDAKELHKFLFYEGMVPNKNGVVLRVEKTPQGAKYFLGNAGTFEALDIWVIERDGKNMKVGRLASLPVKPIRDLPETEIELTENLPGEVGIALAAKDLTEQLVAAGLYKKEAEGLRNIWKDEFFRTPGLHVLYRYPASEYDRMLPISIKPAPAKIVRTGLAWLPHLEDDLTGRIDEQVKLLRNEAFDVREGAFETLKKMGPAAIAHLQALAEKETDAEVLTRIKALTEDVTLDPAKHLKEWERLSKQK